MHWCYMYEHNQNFVYLHNESIYVKLPPYLVMQTHKLSCDVIFVATCDITEVYFLVDMETCG